ncbi:MAG: hypothetical protein A2934_04715 [Candidatus Sungbacteria bacterium RIFCSPLOWO2_01_FULL_47_10]|uniref:Uncharacterized protein n=1 Tax=Candidatus Sungbacteria bacterium RIFCSPLOWO2_01_FULL_47_10 TaxID=1802276 RepID=A0A1G2KYF8_9BACT|nr:MAG: hypothetical protein A2934_04715 [Candidatus Sungbacteria bacterium RIFCSPLOWO2_01_FULL_47_10]
MKKVKESSAQDVFIRRAQDKQDAIFGNMSADQKMKLGSGLWRLAKELDSKKIDYRLWRKK